jgi:hypothetical protein
LKNGWKFVEIEYTVGSLTALNCEMARFVAISFFAPEGSDIQLMYLKLIGDGEINGLDELENPSSNPNKQESLLENDRIVWILVAVGTVFVLILVCLVCCCCGGTTAIAGMLAWMCGKRDPVRCLHCSWRNHLHTMCLWHALLACAPETPAT